MREERHRAVRVNSELTALYTHAYNRENAQNHARVPARQEDKMAELLGLGCFHGPIILTPPEVWAKGRERIFARVPGYEPPAQLLEEL